ncbi:flagellar hook-length control protein FliK [Thiorhodospira sibirica]|uniref:flagellar hook-length control protein FliK n=1 Tax=Thiorhodospira sibirica TaxID=154347 RepID=UPI00022C33B3|nr:flagellar hook-length control protein FliK [Thiorhodospira sibirica]
MEIPRPVPAVGTSTASVPQALGLQPGQTVHLRVTGQTSQEGMTPVQIAGHRLEARLPVSATPGDSLQLKVLTLEPRLSFTLAEQRTSQAPPASSPPTPGTRVTTSIASNLAYTPTPSTPEGTKAVQQLALLARYVAPLSVSVPQGFSTQAWQIGQQFSAQVLAPSAPEGTTLLRLEGQPVAVRLPILMQPGNAVDMRVFTATPQPSLRLASAFSLLQTAPSSTSTAATAPPVAASVPATQPVTAPNITPALPSTPQMAAPQAQAAAPAPTTPTQQVIPINTPVPPSLASQLMQPGQTLQAQVIGTSAQNGTTLLQVNNQSVELRLPVPVNPGQTLELKVLTLSPRPALGVVVNTPAPALPPTPSGPAPQPVTPTNITPAPPSTSQAAVPSNPPNAPQVQATTPAPTPPTQQVIPINTPVPLSLASQLIQPGQTLQAQVMGTSAQTGTTLLQVNNQSVELRLPVPVNPGQALELKILTLSPRPVLGVVVNTPVPQTTPPAQTAPLPTPSAPAPAVTAQTAAAPQAATATPPSTAPAHQVQAAVPPSSTPPNAPQIQAATPAPTPPTQQVIPINTPVPPSLASQLMQSGQSLQAQVIGTSAQNGTTLVQVNNQSVELRLPIPVNPGQALELRVLTLSPRPTLGMVIPMPAVSSPVVNAPSLPTGLNPVLAQAPPQAPLMQTALTPTAIVPPSTTVTGQTNPLSTPLAATSVAPNTVLLSLPPTLSTQQWQAGQVMTLHALGHSARDGTTLMQLGQQAVAARMPIPMAAGESVALRVVSVGPQPMLTLANPVPAATPQAPVATPPAVASPPSQPVFSPEMVNALARQVRQSLPVQSAQLPLLELLNQLASQQQGKAQSLLPEQIKQLNEALLRLLPTPAQMAQAEGLRKAILRSGMFYESRIQAISSSDSVSAPPQDLKSILLSLAERLRSMPNPPPALLRSLYQEGMRRAAELPPPRREGSPTPQARAAPVDLALFSREALLEMLKIRTQGALSRVVLHQVANAESAEQGQARWLMELPLRAQNAMELIHLLLEKDTQQGGKEDKDPTWRAEMALDLPELGAVRIRITVCGDRVSTHFWAETAGTVKRLGESLPRLREGLTARELLIGNMGCYAGEPPPTTPPAEQARKDPQGMVDSHV